MECAKHRELFSLHSTVTGIARSKHNALATLVVKWQLRFCIKVNNAAARLKHKPTDCSIVQLFAAHHTVMNMFARTARVCIAAAIFSDGNPQLTLQKQVLRDGNGMRTAP